MRVTTTSCDRCGQQKVDPFGMASFDAVELSPFGGGFVDKIHLCPDCTGAFRRWLRSGPDAGESNPEPEPEPEPAESSPLAPWPPLRSDRGKNGPTVAVALDVRYNPVKSLSRGNRLETHRCQRFT